MQRAYTLKFFMHSIFLACCANNDILTMKNFLIYGNTQARGSQSKVSNMMHLLLAFTNKHGKVVLGGFNGGQYTQYSIVWQTVTRIYI